MKGSDFLEQCRRELDASTEREKLVSLFLAVEQLVGETPGCDIDGQKTLKELYGKMAEFAQKNQKTGYYAFVPSEAEKFIRGYLGLGERKPVRLEDFL